MTVAEFAAVLARMPQQAELVDFYGLPVVEVIARVTPHAVRLNPIGSLTRREPRRRPRAHYHKPTYPPKAHTT